jgi:ZIP family zinc transporter
MLEATLWGLLGASSLLLGALLATIGPVHRWLVARHEWRLGLLMAFGAGVLVSAVAYELVEEAVAASTSGVAVGAGLVAGSVAFFVGDEAIGRLGRRGRSGAAGGAGASGGTGVDAEDEDGGGPVAILLGAILDGIPESVVVGISLLGGGTVSVAVLAAVLLSNVPEAISSTPGLVTRFGTRTTLAMWAVVVVASGLAAGIGYAALGDAPPPLVAAIQAFAAGAILVMLADEMIPGAHHRGHTAAGLATAIGFAAAAALSFTT